MRFWVECRHSLCLKVLVYLCEVPSGACVRDSYCCSKGVHRGGVCVCERERERERVHADCFELLLVNNSSMNHDIRED